MFINFFSFFHNFVSRKKGDKVLTEIFLLEKCRRVSLSFHFARWVGWSRTWPLMSSNPRPKKNFLGRAMEKEMNNLISPIVKHLWNVTMSCIIFRVCHKHNSLQLEPSSTSTKELHGRALYKGNSRNCSYFGRYQTDQK